MAEVPGLVVCVTIKACSTFPLFLKPPIKLLSIQQKISRKARGKELPSLLQETPIVDTRTLLSVHVHRGEKLLHEGIALNEAVIAQGAVARLIDLKTSVSGEPLTTFHADGLIVSTPTGSTAYNLAAGGPIVHPNLAALILTPINPHSFSQKPIVLPGHHVVRADVLSKAYSSFETEIGLSLDGQSYVALTSGDVITLRLAEHSVSFLRRKQDTFFATLRSLMMRVRRCTH